MPSERTIRTVVLCGVGVVAVATAATSASSLYDLGVRNDMGDYFSAALFIALDVGGGVGALAWLFDQGATRKWGRAVAIWALASSLAGNGIDHAMKADLIPKTLGLVLAVGATIPAALFAVVHLAALMLRPVARPVVTVAEFVDERVDENPEDEKTTDDDAPDKDKADEEERADPNVVQFSKRPETDIAKARRLLKEGVGRPTLIRELRISDGMVKQLQKLEPEQITAERLADYQARAKERQRA